MATTQVLLRDRPNRVIALRTGSQVLSFRHSPSTAYPASNASSTSLPSQLPVSTTAGPRCIVELASVEKTDTQEYRVVSRSVHGCLGLITIENDVFLCVVSGSTRTAILRPGEAVQKILSVDFYCLNRSDYDHLNDEINMYPTDTLDEEGYEQGHTHGRRDPTLEHPCLALRKLLSGGSFYYSADFDLTSRLQDRERSSNVSFDFDSFDKGYLWNSYMIRPLIDFRSRLSDQERNALDSTRLLTAAIRGYASTMTVPAPASPARSSRTGLPSTLTLLSRLSCNRAGTRFNSRGIDDDGNVANFVETETIFWTPEGICFSYVQIRGSVPMFWEQSAGLLPGQQKVQLTRSPQATQPAFDKHFEALELKYGPIHVVNLLSKEKPGEVEISQRYQNHVSRSSLNRRDDGESTTEHDLLRETHYDFHAETRATGYEAARGIRRYIQDSLDSFGYCLTEIVDDQSDQEGSRRSTVILQQDGVYRTNCLDCLDRTNVMQTVISQMGLESFLSPRGEHATGDFLARHGSLWADNGDMLSKIYAGTGALKSSFTRSGKMSLAGALADARKSATRMYINNFADKGRQTVMDMLLGRLVGQSPVYLFDPINDYVTSELSRRAQEFSSHRDIRIWAGTFNLNGRSNGLRDDLSAWLCPAIEPAQQNPEIVAVGFQEIVELSPQQIMSTEPTMRQAWEKVVKRTLNANAKANGSEEYVLLRGGQLVGASLSIFVKSGLLPHVKNVEGSLKKTGMSGMAGNKGAVAIRLEVDDTSCCFVTAHLAAGFANYEERNRDYHTISQGLRFQRNRSIDDHDTVIWLGDFNYRIGLSFEKARNHAKLEDYGKLYENDQLNLQMVAGLTFPHYSEARILFRPTYKYDIGSDEYDTSEKSRIPAWTDRILRKGSNIRQINYDSAPLRFSDHRPVYATFICTISVVDDKLKGAMSREIYDHRRGVMGKAAARDTSESDDDDLLGYETVGSGLPPASGHERKWWLDNSLPARSNLQAPSRDHMPNPNRPSNPFILTSKPDWVQRPGISNQFEAARINSRVTGSSTNGTGMLGLQPDRLHQPTVLDKIPHRTVSQASTTSTASTSSNGTVIRKPAVPRKPVRLSSFSSSPPPSVSQAPTSNSAPAPPPPRRSSTKPMNGGASTHAAFPGVLSTRNLQDREDEAAPPTLPARRLTNQDVMDDPGGDGGDPLSSWTPLKPS